MAALTDERNTKQLGVSHAPGKLFIPLKANAKVFKGGIVCVDATGFGVKGATATGLIAVGRAENTVDNTGGADGAVGVNVTLGVHKFANSEDSDLIAQADVFSNCYIVDDQTVAKTDGSAQRSVAGKVVKVDSDGVYVSFNPLA